MQSEEFYKLFQKKYAIVNAYEKTRYNLVYELYLIKKCHIEMLSPLITFTTKTFPWPNPMYELDDKISYYNTILAIDQYIIDVQEIILTLQAELNTYKIETKPL
jgi:hypothetical protein